MSRKLKRALSLIIAVAMLFTLCAFAAAVEGDETDESGTIPVADDNAEANEAAETDETAETEEAAEADEVEETDVAEEAVVDDAAEEPKKESQPTADVQINGEIIAEYPSGVLPYYNAEIGKVFVPFRDLLTALGAVVSYDEYTSAAIAVREDLTISYVLGADDYSVKIDGETRVISSDVKPININGRILVPVRFISESLGAKVGWDSAAQTVLIVDPYLIKAANTATYEIFDKIYDISAPTDKNTEAHADIDFGFSLVDSEGTLALPTTATVDLVASDKAVDAKINAIVDVSSLLGAIIPGLTAQIDLDAELIYNIGTGTFAIQSDGLYAIAEEFLGINLGIQKGAWVKLDVAEILAGAAGITVPDDADALADTKTIVDYTTTALVQSAPLASVNDYATLSEILAIVNGLYADDGFVKSGNDYVSKVTVDEEDAKGTFTLTIRADANGKATGIALDFDIAGDADQSVTLHLDTDGAKLALAFTFSADGTDISLKLDLTSKVTDKAPRTDVPKGATVVDLGGLI
ncbi:MAG: copper amine oxidase N-terminal domain-containing protein [Oscillospiraceae bacterium]|jgi:hypothetical protein|nr:copper amine oxidase N-terminal domain-containing protein [Oscillospiraceae bacterium]